MSLAIQTVSTKTQNEVTYFCKIVVNIISNVLLMIFDKSNLWPIKIPFSLYGVQIFFFLNKCTDIIAFSMVFKFSNITWRI